MPDKDGQYLVELIVAALERAGQAWEDDQLKKAADDLVSLVSAQPRARWPTLVEEYVTHINRLRTAGDAIEARSRSFSAARSSLRMALLPRDTVPNADLTVPTFLDELVEVVSLDAGSSLRYLSRALAAGWAVPVDELIAEADAQLLDLPLDRGDLTNRGHPDVHAITVEEHGPYIGTIVRHVEQVAPDAIGLLGTLVAVPLSEGLLYRALDPSPSLRRDLFALSMMAAELYDVPGHRVSSIPLWRRPDGTYDPVAFTFDEDDGTVATSYHPGFDAALRALDDPSPLPVPGWARGRMDPLGWDRLARIIAAAGGLTLDDVAAGASALRLLELVEQCNREPRAAWFGLTVRHLAAEREAHGHVMTLAQEAAVRPQDVLDHLSVYLAREGAADAGAVNRPAGIPGLVEVLALSADDGATRPIDADVASQLGTTEGLFARALEGIRAGLDVRPVPGPLLSGDLLILTGRPSASAAATRLAEWAPEASGRYGAVVALGAGGDIHVLPVRDSAFVLDLPALIGMAVGAFVSLDWPLLPAVAWIGPHGVHLLEARLNSYDQVEALSVPPEFAVHAAQLPERRDGLPAGLEAELGRDGAVRFFGHLRAAMLDRLLTDPAGLVEVTPALLRDLSLAAARLPAPQWPDSIRGRLDDAAASRRRLDWLEAESRWEQAAEALLVRVAVQQAPPPRLVARPVPGGLVASVVLRQGGRFRRLRQDVVDRWGVDRDAIWARAGANTVSLPGLVDEAIPDAPAACRQLYHDATEAEAAALFLHLRGQTKRGYAVSITHTTRAHYLRLDDPDGMRILPAFVEWVAGIYREASRYADAHSSALLWLRPDGSLVELLDVLDPLPGLRALPAELRGHRLS